MPAEFALSEEPLGDGRHVVAVRGEIDLFTAPELKKTLADAIENGATRVVVDLSETTFLDSTALGVLIGAVKRLRSRDGQLVIVNTDANIAKTFEITGLDQIFTILDTRDAAVDALDGAGSRNLAPAARSWGAFCGRRRRRGRLLYSCAPARATRGPDGRSRARSSRPRRAPSAAGSGVGRPCVVRSTSGLAAASSRAPGTRYDARVGARMLSARDEDICCDRADEDATSLGLVLRGGPADLPARRRRGARRVDWALRRRARGRPSRPGAARHARRDPRALETTGALDDLHLREELQADCYAGRLGPTPPACRRPAPRSTTSRRTSRGTPAQRRRWLMRGWRTGRRGDVRHVRAAPPVTAGGAARPPARGGVSHAAARHPPAPAIRSRYAARCLVQTRRARDRRLGAALAPQGASG